MAAMSSAQGAALTPTLCPGDQAGARGAGIGYCLGGNYSGSDNFLVYSLGGNFPANFFHYFLGGNLGAGGSGRSGLSDSCGQILPETCGRWASARSTIEDTI